MAAGDEKQDELQRGLQQRKEDGAPKPPGAFTQFFEIDKVQPQSPAGNSNVEGGLLASSSTPSSASNLLNEDAPFANTDAAAGQAALGAHNEVPSSHIEAWSASTVRPLRQRQDTFSGFFHHEDQNDLAPASASGLSPTPTFGSPGFVPLTPDDRPAAVFPVSGNESLERFDNVGTGPMVLPDPHPGSDRQKATRLFSPTKPIAEPIAPLHGPSAYTRVIDSSVHRVDEQQAAFIPPATGNPPPQAPTPAMAPVPFAAPQWPNPHMYPLLSPPQAAVALPAAPPAGAMPVLQPQVRPAEQTPQPGWMAYMPLIIGLNVLLFLTAIFVLIFALSSR